MRSTPIPLLLIAVFTAQPSAAQEGGKNIFADPQNLKLLPEDISPADLGKTMKGFAMGLGVRCESCHVGESGAPLETFDFQSDEKAMKRKARVMIEMVRDLNARYIPGLNEIEDAPRVDVRCVTCHRGRPQPKLIEDIMDEQLAENGIDAAVAEYNRLRESYFGSHSFDFSEFTLPMYAQAIAGRGEAEAAIALAMTNIDNFPESYYSYFVLAELYRATEQTDAAIDSYERAAELNPGAKPLLDAKIAELGAPGE